MKYKHIPHTDLYPSVICLGTVSFGNTLDTCNAFHLLDTFFEHGGNFIDTAHIYGGWASDGLGLSEKTIGQWVKERGVEENIIIATKGAHPLLSAMHIPRLSRQDILTDLDESLRCLQREAIDLYWLHRDDPKRPVADILETLNSQVTQGKIRYFGCSNWRLERIKEAQEYSALHGMQGFAGNQLMWSLAIPNPEAFSDPTMVWMDGEMKAYHLQSGLAALAYTSQARGFFARLAQSPIDELPETLNKHYGNQENLKRMARLKKLAEEVSLPLSVLSLAYIVSQPFPAYAISGCSNMEQLRENLRAGDVQLEPALLDYLDG